MVGERDYSQFSPQQLNAELASVVELLPTWGTLRSLHQDYMSGDPNVPPDAEDIDLVDSNPSIREIVGAVLNYDQYRFFARRLRRIKNYRNSELRPLMFERLRTLFSYSQLTPSTQEIIFSDFSMGYERVDFLKLNSSSGGIYDPADAKEVARNFIRDKQDLQERRIRFRDSLAQVDGAENLPVGDLQNGKRALFRKTERELLVKARQEFIEKYGEEP